MYTHDNQNVEISYGDRTTIKFEFFDKNKQKLLNENVILTVKKNVGDSSALLIKTCECLNTNKASFDFEPNDFQELPIGLYFYDLFLKDSKFTPFAPKQFNVKGVVHDVN